MSREQGRAHVPHIPGMACSRGLHVETPTPVWVPRARVMVRTMIIQAPVSPGESVARMQAGCPVKSPFQINNRESLHISIAHELLGTCLY